MKKIYKLVIRSNEENIEKIYNTIKIDKANLLQNTWSYELIENENDAYIDFITTFSNIISKNKVQLTKLKITTEDISIWLLYGYKGQCNMEFSPTQMTKLGKLGITLCISCWEDS